MAAAEAALGTRERRPRGRVVVRYASFETRVASAMLDALVSFTIMSLFVLAGSLIVLLSSDFERVDPSDTALYAFWALVGLSVVVVFLYLFVGLAWKGQTIGGAIMQVMVIRSDGRPLGVAGAMARVVGLLVYPLMLAAGGIAGYALDGTGPVTAVSLGVAGLVVTIGIVWGAFHSRRQMLHDRLAGTIVVRLR